MQRHLEYVMRSNRGIRCGGGFTEQPSNWYKHREMFLYATNNVSFQYLETKIAVEAYFY